MIEFIKLYIICQMRGRKVKVVDGVSFKIEKGEFVAIVLVSQDQVIYLYEHNRSAIFVNKW